MKKKAKTKTETIYIPPTDEQIRRAVAEITPMKEEMESWMGCREFTLSVINLHGTVDSLLDFTWKLRKEHIPEWFADNANAFRVMDTYLSDVEQVVNMVKELKLVKERKSPNEDNIHIENY